MSEEQRQETHTKENDDEIKSKLGLDLIQIKSEELTLNSQTEMDHQSDYLKQEVNATINEVPTVSNRNQSYNSTYNQEHTKNYNNSPSPLNPELPIVTHIKMDCEDTTYNYDNESISSDMDEILRICKTVINDDTVMQMPDFISLDSDMEIDNEFISYLNVDNAFASDIDQISIEKANTNAKSTLTEAITLSKTIIETSNSTPEEMDIDELRSIEKMKSKINIAEDEVKVNKLNESNITRDKSPTPNNNLTTSGNFDHTQTFFLIDLYKQEEVLWNTNLKKYKCPRSRRQAASRIANKITIPNFDAKSALSLLTYFKTGYRKELIRIQSAIDAGFASYKPTLYWFDRMEFIKPYLNPIPHDNREVDSTKNSNSVTSFNPEESKQGIHSSTQAFVKEINNSHQFKVNDEQSEAASSDIDEKTINEIRSDDLTVRKTSIISSCDGQGTSRVTDFQLNKHPGDESTLPKAIVVRKIYSNQEAILRKVHDLSNQNDDSHDAFAKHAASLIRALPKVKALQLQVKIIDLINSTRSINLKNY